LSQVQYRKAGRVMSSRSIPTTIIGPKGLLRDSLASLLGSYSYRVTDCHQSAADMPSPPEEEGTHMVLLTVRSVDAAVAECDRIRRNCTSCKIVGLMENIPNEDLPKLVHSEMDGCMPLDVSQDVLTKTLDIVMSGSTRIVVLVEETHATAASPPAQQKSGPASEESGSSRGNGYGGKSDDGSNEGQDRAPKASALKTYVQPFETCASPSSNVRDRSIANSPANHASNQQGQQRFLGAPASGANCLHAVELTQIRTLGDLSHVPSLSDRERQIVEGLVKGHPNKTIARACGITEATVKVHMKAILRKVPCTNRTQVAIWALEHADMLGAPANNGKSFAPGPDE
jgi:two-component system, NarL family, nitrate/nitrite response regulator NarL